MLLLSTIRWFPGAAGSCSLETGDLGQTKREPGKYVTSIWPAIIVPICLVAVLLVSSTYAADATPDLGINADLHGKSVFPADDAWNRDISGDPVDPASQAILTSIGLNKSLHADF